LGVPGLIGNSNATIIAQQATNTAAIAALYARVQAADSIAITGAATNTDYIVYLTGNCTGTVSMVYGQVANIITTHSTSNQVITWPAGMVYHTGASSPYTNTTGVGEMWGIWCYGTNGPAGALTTNIWVAP
jgi:hypothetical protein